MANYTSGSVHVLTTLPSGGTDFNTENTFFQKESDVPADANFTSTIGTISAGNITLNLSPPIPGSDNKARRTWLTGKRPVKGQLYPRGVYNK